MVRELLLGTFAMRVIYLHLDSLSDRIVFVAHVKVKSAVSLRFDLVIELDLKVLVLLLRPKIRRPSGPPLFAGSRCEGHHAVGTDTPIACRFPVLLQVISGE